MTPEIQALALHVSATKTAITILVKCLMNNGALRPGQFPSALKSTFNEADADWNRPDYEFLRQLAHEIEIAEHNDRK